MKNYYIILPVLFLFSIGSAFEGMAQDTIKPLLKEISFRTVVYTSSSTNRGYLTHIGDSLIGISPNPVRFSPSPANEKWKSVTAIPYENINKMTIHRKGAGTKGALIGGLSGMVIGIAAGLIAGDDPHVPPSEDFFGLGEAFRTTAGQKALAGGVVGLVGGGVIGCIIGNLVKKKFIIGGNKKNFEDMRQAILNKAYTKNKE